MQYRLDDGVRGRHLDESVDRVGRKGVSRFFGNDLVLRPAGNRTPRKPVDSCAEASAHVSSAVSLRLVS